MIWRIHRSGLGGPRHESADPSSASSLRHPATTSMLVRLRSVGLVTVIGATLFVAGPATLGEAASPSDQVLQWGSIGLGEAPYDPVQDWASWYTVERLLDAVPEGPAPWLATSVETPDGGRTWTVTLQDGVTFQNGAPMTAQKIADWLTHELANDWWGANYPNAQIGTNGDLIVTVSFPEARPSFDLALAAPEAGVYDVDALATITDTDFTRLAGLGVWTGPYALTDIVPGKWTYAANQGYWQGTPALDGIELIGVADGQSAIAAVAAGELHIAWNIPPGIKPVAEATNGVHYVVQEASDTPEFMQLRPNVDRLPWSDVAVRRALALTIDSAALSDAATFGVYPAVTGIYPNGDWFHLDWMGQDLVEANRILDEAGWVLGADGVRVRDGVRLAGEILTTDEAGNGLAVPLAETAKQAGFGLTPTLVDAAVGGDRMVAGDFDLLVNYGQRSSYSGDPAGFCVMFDPNDVGIVGGGFVPQGPGHPRGVRRRPRRPGPSHGRGDGTERSGAQRGAGLRDPGDGHGGGPGRERPMERPGVPRLHWWQGPLVAACRRLTRPFRCTPVPTKGYSSMRPTFPSDLRDHWWQRKAD